MKKLLLLTVLLAALVCVGSQAAADTITCPITADVYIDQGTPAGNFNIKTRVLISWHSTKGIARGLLKFNIPEGLQAAGITSAVMHVSKNSTGGVGVQSNVSIYALNSVFDETAETWNTHSGGDYDSSVGSSGTLPMWTTEITQATLDLTTLLTGNLDKVRDNGILIKITNESGTNVNQNFASKEEINEAPYFDPYLEITYTSGTAISLVDFNAIAGSNSVNLTWSTASETDNAGFNIYRAGADGEFVKINAEIIPAQGTATSGAAYSFVDDAARNRQTYSYKLEDVDLSGAITTHGPIQATPRFIYLFK
jgi:hypothetical protein